MSLKWALQTETLKLNQKNDTDLMPINFINTDYKILSKGWHL